VLLEKTINATNAETFTMIRNPAVAGQFYPQQAKKLNETIAAFFPQDPQSSQRKDDVVAVISPHAGYVYSGDVAAKTLWRVRDARTYIIIGPNHTGYGEEFSIMREGSWKMPLGDIAINTPLASRIVENSSIIEDDPQAHLHEHSLEVQLPFLQYMNKKQFDFVPIVIGGGTLRELKDIAKTIAAAVEDTRDCAVVASSDMSHYEPQSEVESKDKLAISHILALDEDALYESIRHYGISMCGYASAVIAVSYARLKGARDAELIHYHTSGDINGDYVSVVGYAGIAIRG